MKEQTVHRLAFDVYVKMGVARSLDALHTLIAADPLLLNERRLPARSTLERWSAAFHWQARLLDLERDAAVQDRRDQVRALREMGERHAKEGIALKQRAVQRLSNLSPDEMTPQDAVRALVEGVRLERLGRGVPTEHVQQDGATTHAYIDLGRFTDEELRRLVELAERSATGAGKAHSR